MALFTGLHFPFTQNHVLGKVLVEYIIVWTSSGEGSHKQTWCTSTAARVMVCVLSCEVLFLDLTLDPCDSAVSHPQVLREGGVQ